jgi:hypothetical protein
MLILNSKIAKGLRGQEHNGDVPAHRFQAATWNPKLLVDVDLETFICWSDFV